MFVCIFKAEWCSTDDITELSVKTYDQYITSHGDWDGSTPYPRYIHVSILVIGTT